MLSSRKRKHRNESDSKQFSNSNYTLQERQSSPDPALFVQAYEADIIRGPSAVAAAESLEIPSSSQSQGIGSALLRWGGTQRDASKSAWPGDEDFEIDLEAAKTDDHSNSVWVDRYDARLLLDSLPVLPDPIYTAPPDSPSGWSDLPSDSEDTFFLTPEEVDDFRRDKRRRLIDRNREERLKARRAEDGEETEEQTEEPWGGSDEEPDGPQKELMKRTAVHLSASPNPAQLEMRILANHGGDKRFAFLRGRWSRTWKIAKGKARMEKEKEQKKTELAKGLGVLADYGDSDVGSGSSDGGDSHAIESESVREGRGVALVISVEDVAQEVGGVRDSAAQQARRARAKEWAEKRRALKDRTG